MILLLLLNILILPLLTNLGFFELLIKIDAKKEIAKNVFVDRLARIFLMQIMDNKKEIEIIENKNGS